MREGPGDARVLALDARHRICGYAAFDKGQLLDWGCLRNTAEAVVRGLGRIEHMVSPGILLLRRVHSCRLSKRSSARAVTRIASKFARRHGWAVEYVTEGALQHYFRRSGFKTNEEIAAALANTFPELKPRLPAHRRVWEPQDWRLPIFDAVGLAVAFLAARSMDAQNDA